MKKKYKIWIQKSRVLFKMYKVKTLILDKTFEIENLNKDLAHYKSF